MLLGIHLSLKMPLPCVQVSREGPNGLSVMREKNLESICELDSIEVMVKFSRIIGNVSGLRKNI